MRHVWLIPVGGALLAPLVTWLPMLALRVPGLGLPQYEPAQGIDIWGLQVFWLVAFGVGAAGVGQRDRWLGVGPGPIRGPPFLLGGQLGITHSVVFLIAALGLMAMRDAPGHWHHMIQAVLAASGIFQVAYVLQQWAGYDLLWGPLVGGGQLKDVIQPLGTLGTVDGAGAYIALTAPLMPLWALPFAAAAVLKTKSLGAIAALLVGLLVRSRLRWPWWGLTGALGFGVLGWRYFIQGGGLPTTVLARLQIWHFALGDWLRTDPILGVGLGGWPNRIPFQQVKTPFMPSNELFLEAHKEDLQFLYEAGLIGAVVAGLWLWSHRHMFRHALWGGTIAAAAISSLTFFPLHVVALGLVVLLAVGCALGDLERPEVSDFELQRAA